MRLCEGERGWKEGTIASKGQRNQVCCIQYAGNHSTCTLNSSQRFCYSLATTAQTAVSREFVYLSKRTIYNTLTSNGVWCHHYCAFVIIRKLCSTNGCFSPAISHLSGPLRKQRFTLTGSKDHVC